MENGASFSVERQGQALYLYFEPSHGREDWQNNLDFPAMPYKRMADTVWFAHRGFLRVWKSAERYVAPLVQDPAIRRMVAVGYSHGAALAVFCQEYIWFHRPDLRHRAVGYGFACPRVVWGVLSPRLAQRWEGFTVVRNLDDPVTHLPPAALGYTHVGRMLEIGKTGRYSGFDAHRPENMMQELQTYEQGLRL